MTVLRHWSFTMAIRTVSWCAHFQIRGDVLYIRSLPRYSSWE
jgi:hypothetical protein